MRFIVEIADTSFNMLERLEREAINLKWDNARIGGCGSFSFDLSRRFCDEKFISGDFNIKIKARNPLTSAYDLWYQGLVEEKLPNVRASNEVITVQGHGYQAQLSRIYISKTYTSTEVSLIVKDILDTFVVPNTNISYSGADIVDTGFTPTTLTFNTDALSALQTCADIVGSREWGVDATRKFFFKARSSSVGFQYVMGGPTMLDFSVDYSFLDIVNRVVIQGGDVAGTPYTNTYNDTVSQLKYNLRTQVIQNSSITTDDVASQYAASIFAEFNDVIRKGQANILEDRQFESMIPIPLFQVVAPGVTYGQKLYGTFLYAGKISYQVNRISYSLDNNSNLKTQLDLGKLRPTLAEQFEQVKYELEQLRSGGL